MYRLHWPMSSKHYMSSRYSLEAVTLVEFNRRGMRRYRTLVVFVVVAVVATLVDVAANVTLSRYQLKPAAATVVALLPLPGNLTLIFLILRAVRKLDEFKQRIHFEAVVFAFLATGV